MSNASSKAHNSKLHDTAVAKDVEASWNPWWGLGFFFIVFLGAQLLAGVLISIYPFTQHWTAAEAAHWLTHSIVAQFGFMLLVTTLTVGMVYLYLRRFKPGIAVIGLRRPETRDFAYGVLAVVPYFGLYFLVVGLIVLVAPHLDTGQKQELGFNNVHGNVELLLTFFSLVILPPISEEILFRGFLLTNFKKILPLVYAAIGTSLIFAVAHLPEGGSAGPLYIAAIDTFVLSMVLVYLRQKTGALWSSMVLHAIKNGIAFTFLYLYPHLHIGF